MVEIKIKWTHLDLSSEVLGASQLGLLVGEAALDDSSVVPGASVDGLSVLVPEGDVHVLLAGALDRVGREGRSDQLK